MAPRRIYLDYNATTPLAPAAAQAMAEAASELWGNPSSVHREGQRARAAIERARRQVADLIGGQAREVRFTSGATEAINWVHRSVPGPCLISAIEHPAVLEASRAAATRIVVGVTESGHVDVDAVARELDRGVALVSIQLANNEIGAIQPIAEVAALCRARGVLFHTDATQAVGRIPVAVAELDVDYMSFSAHKLYGPKGVGALWARSGAPVMPLLTGGAQERGLRGGTENLLGILGFGVAAESARGLEAEGQRQRSFIQRLWAGLGGLAAVRNGGEPAVPNTLNVSFLGCDAEGLLMALDLEGIGASAGSACSAGSLEPSHVIRAITSDRERQRSALRFSVGRPTTEEDIDEALPRIVGCVGTIRR